jgi:hypothetical protein
MHKLGTKNINIFSYKNPLGLSAEMENNLYKKIYCITLCNFRHRS